MNRDVLLRCERWLRRIFWATVAIAIVDAVATLGWLKAVVRLIP